MFFNLKLKISGYHKIGLKNRCIENGIWLNDLQSVLLSLTNWPLTALQSVSKYKMIVIMYKGHWIHVMMIHIFLFKHSLFVVNLISNYYMSMLGWAEYQWFCRTLKKCSQSDIRRLMYTLHLNSSHLQTRGIWCQHNPHFARMISETDNILFAHVNGLILWLYYH